MILIQKIVLKKGYGAETPPPPESRNTVEADMTGNFNNYKISAYTIDRQKKCSTFVIQKEVALWPKKQHYRFVWMRI